MKLAFKDIEPFARKPPAAALAVLIYGPDEGLARERLNLLTKHVVSDLNDTFNIAEFSQEALLESPSRLMDEAKSISMLGGRRAIRLRGATDKTTPILKDVLAALSAGDNFILVEAGELTPRSSLRLLFETAPNAAALPCYTEDERDLSRVIGEQLRNSGYTIAPEALGHFSASVVGDRAVARMETEKLITYMGAAKTIAPEDVIACVGNSAALSLDDLSKAVGLGQFADADKIARFILSEGLPAVTVLRTLQNHFTRLLLTKARVQKGEDIEFAMKKLKPDVFWKQKAAFTAQVALWPQEQLEQGLILLMTAEARCKQSHGDPELLCSRAILSLSQIAARASSRKRA